MITKREICETANKGCIDDPVKAKKILDEFSEMKLGTILDNTGHSARREVFYQLMYMSDLPGFILGDLTMKETFVMIRSLDDSTLKGYVYTADEYRRFFLSSIAEILTKGADSICVLKQLLGLNIYTYYECLKSMDPDADIAIIKEKVLDLCRKNLRIPVNKRIRDHTANIGEILKDAMRLRDFSWKVWRNIDDYREKMLSLYEIVEQVLLDPFVMAYGGKDAMSRIVIRWNEMIAWDYANEETESVF